MIAPQQVVLALAGEPQKPISAERLQALLQAGAVREPALKTWILAHLQRRGAVTGKRGIFVVAVATHGFNDRGRDFLVGADTLHGFIQDTGIKVDIVFDQVALAHAPRRLVLLDACRERLSQDTRAGTADAVSAMSKAFADAIANASGQVVLSGTTLGGYSYDDYELKNGVFTAAVLDGLRGEAEADERHFITARTLGDYIDQRVRRWVRDNRREHMEISKGMSRQFEGPASSMPLAVDPDGIGESHRQRIEAALQKLRDNIGGPIPGSVYDEVAQVLAADLPTALREELLLELETLDGSQITQRSFASEGCQP